MDILHKLKKQKSVIASILVVLVIILALLVLYKNKGKEEDSEIPTVIVRIQEDNASLNGIVLALEGEIVEDEKDSDKTTFKAEGQEVIITLGNEFAIVNKEEKPLRTATEHQDVEVKEEVKPSGAYVDQDEVFVPIEFIEDVFDLEFNDETLEFIKDDEVIAPSEVEEAPELPKVEDLETEEEEIEKETEEETEEDGEVENKEEKPETSNDEATNSSSSSNTSSSNTSNGSNSSSNTNSSQAPGNAGSSNTTNNSASTTGPAQPAEVVVKGISLNKGNTTLDVGGTLSVSATISPSNATNQMVKWTSSNASVAAVDENGNVKAVAAGTATITATSISNTGVKASLIITVNQPAPVQPTYTGNSVVSQLLNEGFSKGMLANSAAWSPYGDNMTADWYDVEVVALNGQDNLDLQIRVAGFDWDNCFTYANKALVKVIPSGASTVINALKNGQSGTWTFDGRTVKVYFTSSGYINISGKK